MHEADEGRQRLGAKGLQHDNAAQLGIFGLADHAGLLDHAHPSFTELLGDAVVRDGLADHAGPILPRYGLMVKTTVRTRYPPKSSLAT